jgi:CBS domain-containing protein
MNLSNLFTRGVVTVTPDAPLAIVAAKMQGNNVGAVIVEENKRPVGIVTDRDLALALGANGVSTQVPVREVMTRHVLAVPDDTEILAATKYMRERHVRRLPVVDKDDRLIGIVTLDDLLSFLGRELYNLAESIKTEFDGKLPVSDAAKKIGATKSAAGPKR